MTYKSVMIEDIPNFLWVFGYVNAPWTLKCDIASRYVCRLMKHMDANGYKVATPTDNANNRMEEGALDSFEAGYAQRAKHMLPRQGRSGPWKLEMNYGRDKKILLKQPLVDEFMQFDKAVAKQPSKPEEQANAA